MMTELLTEWCWLESHRDDDGLIRALDGLRQQAILERIISELLK